MPRLMMLSAAVMALTFGSVDVQAAGGGGGGGGGGGEAEAQIADADYQAAMAAAKKQDWKQVVARMAVFSQRNPRNADGWNELGHAYRKLGDMDNSLKHYAKALQIDPKHKGAHEYLGEAYLQLGDLARAEQELRALDSICFLPCEQYSDLKEQIRRYKAERSTASAR
jgi:tetratricopeptide (TPR) repeat protein